MVGKKRIIALVWLVAACEPPTSPTRIETPITSACISAAAAAPAPWTYGDWAPANGFRNSYLVSAELTDLGLNLDYSKVSRPYVTAYLESCSTRPAPAVGTICARVAERRHQALARRSDRRSTIVRGMLVDNAPYFTSVDESFFGMCDGTSVDNIEARESDPSSACRVWVTDQRGASGLELWMPEIAFYDIPEIVKKASYLLEPRFDVCAGQVMPR